ncbi:hypothetical protein C8A00DRAFT_40003 [Chaetomidium leptoderma]|uniref:DUF6536 domain-containing protein n=1 Tax=Chaetomidium leptoderma TaxID=669021 RepID=A0AAN6VWB8_9PEZI|nr:hypothetical protein C8A00DRAFT_40003 [Chaetomidium leptoderma]
MLRAHAPDRVSRRDQLAVVVVDERLLLRVERPHLGEDARVRAEQVGEGRGGEEVGTTGGGGWRAGVALNVVVAFVVLITGFVCLIVAISGVSLSAGRSAIFEGPCATAAGVDWGVHAVVNVFVVVLVAGANYTFQVLSSPTRGEVNEAHGKGEWLDIGVPSFRNLGHIEGSRTVLAVVVLATAVFTQIMYNAVIFVSQTAPNFKAAVVTESFLRGAAFSNDINNNVGGLSRPDLLALQQQAIRDELVRLPTPVCIDQFSGAFETDYSAVLLISNHLDTPSLVQTSDGANTRSISDLVPDQSSIQYCLAKPAPAPTCEVNLNASLLGSVALLNSIALVATAAVLFKRPSSFRPLATLGDAISSFLEEPDPTTQGACLLSKTDVWQGRWPLTEAKYWVPKNHYWLRSVSFPRWITTFSVWALCVGLSAGGLAFAITSSPQDYLSPFGAVSPHTLIRLFTTTPAAAVAVVASLPQLLLAILYLATNALVTTYHLSHESSLFATVPARPLRISFLPLTETTQTTSLYLTLPRPTSWILMALFTGMAFLLRQSVFAVAVQLVDVPISPNALPPAGSPSDTTTVLVVALGISGTGLLALLTALVVLAVGVLALGLRRAPPVGLVNGERVGNPMVLPAGSCSAVVSARCHPLAREREGLWRKPVMWGVVRDGVGFGACHCAFTAGRAGVVGAGRNYA